jgi:hypothetical protein
LLIHPTMKTTDDLDSLFACRFHDLSPAQTVRAFGVQYVHLSDPEGGELYLTEHGWPSAKKLLPAVWYRGGRFHREGERLTGGTGTVYRLKLSAPGEPRTELVIKFCRFAEYVPLFMPSTLPDSLPGYLADLARFNSPFEEFGLIEDMRRGQFGPRDLRILTKRPLAIYVTPNRHPLWQLGRTEGRFSEYEYALQADQVGREQDEHLHLDIARQYIMLFGWVRGDNAESLQLEGHISEEEEGALTIRVNQELAAKGFRILDNKPKHFILRRRKNGELMRRRGQLVYVQVDFELLQRTDPYLAYLSGGAGI